MNKKSYVSILIVMVSVFISACSERAICDCKPGDTVEEYRHWDYDSKKWINSPDSDMVGTKWLVLNPDPDFHEVHLHLKLVEGQYKNGYVNEMPGFVDNFLDPKGFQEANPGYPSMFLLTFRVVKKGKVTF